MFYNMRNTYILTLVLLQLALQLLVTFFSHMEGIHSCYPLSLFLLHFPMGVVHHLLGPKGGLDGLERKRSSIKKKKKKKEVESLT